MPPWRCNRDDAPEPPMNSRMRLGSAQFLPIGAMPKVELFGMHRNRTALRHRSPDGKGGACLAGARERSQSAKEEPASPERGREARAQRRVV
jgi:hypothetical protein